MRTDEILAKMAQRVKNFAAREDDYRRVFVLMTDDERGHAWTIVMAAYAGATLPAPKKFADALKVKQHAEVAVKNQRGEWPWEERARELRERAASIADSEFARFAGMHASLPTAVLLEAKGIILDKAHMVATLEIDWPHGHQNHWPDGKPENLLHYANKRITGTAHHEWISAEELAMCEGRIRTRESLDHDRAPRQGPQPARVPMPAIKPEPTFGGEYLDGGPPPARDLPPLNAYEDAPWLS